MRIRTRSLIVMFSQGLSQATTIVLGIILVRLISQQDLGTYRQVLLVYGFLAGIIAVNLDSSLYYFLPKYGRESHRRILLQTLLLSFFFAGIIAAVMFLGASSIARIMNNPELASLLKIFFLYPFLERVIAIIPSYLISTDRAIRAGFYTVVSTVGRISAVVIAVLLGYETTGIFWAIILVTAILAIAGVIDIVRLIAPGEWKIDVNLVRMQFQYIWPLWITSTLGIVSVQLDKLLISIFFDPKVYAVYSCGAMELPVVALITSSVSTAMMPNLVVLGEQGKFKDALHLWHEGIRKCSLIIFPCFAFFIFISRDFMVCLYGSDYAMAAWPFRIYLFCLPIRIAVYATLFRAFGMTSVIAISAGISLVTNVVFSLGLAWLGKGTFLSYIGPSAGMTIANFALVGYCLIQLCRIAGVNFLQVMRWKELGFLLGLSVLCGLLMFSIPLPAVPLVVKIVVQALIFISLLMGMVHVTKILKEDEMELLRMPFLMLKTKIFKQTLS